MNSFRIEMQASFRISVGPINLSFLFFSFFWPSLLSGRQALGIVLNLDTFVAKGLAEQLSLTSKQSSPVQNPPDLATFLLNTNVQGPHTPSRRRPWP